MWAVEAVHCSVAWRVSNGEYPVREISMANCSRPDGLRGRRPNRSVLGGWGCMKEYGWAGVPGIRRPDRCGTVGDAGKVVVAPTACPLIAGSLAGKYSLDGDCRLTKKVDMVIVVPVSGISGHRIGILV